MAKKRIEKMLGEDFVGSIRFGLAWARDECWNYEAVEIRLHPLDNPLEKYPYGWPPVVLDESVQRRTAVIVMDKPGEGEQLQLL